MTPEYKARREAKHVAQAEAKPYFPLDAIARNTIDLMPKMARHAFVGLKTHPQANGGRKNRSGYAQEHKQANLDNVAFVVKQLDNPAVVAELAKQALLDNAAFDVQSEKSIGGIGETAGLPTDDGTAI